MSQSKDTPFGCQANVEAGSGGTALPSPRGRKHGLPPLVVLAKGGSVSEATVFELHPCRNRRLPPLDAKRTSRRAREEPLYRLLAAGSTGYPLWWC